MEFEKTGGIAPETPLVQGDGLALYTDAKNAGELAGGSTLSAALKAHLGRAKSGDYVALLPFLELSPANESALQAIRVAIRDRMKVATVLAFGPRYLHSGGQAYKGGTNSGVFLQVTADDPNDVPVPG